MRRSWLVATLVLVAGCNTESTPFVPGVELPAPGQSAGALVGSAGGRIALGDLVLEVPAGALDRDVELRVTVKDEAAPDAFRAYSPRFRFEPEGTRFAEQVTVTLPFEGNADAATIFWTSAQGDAFMALETEVSAGRATARIDHFSEAFVGTGCAGDDCCLPASGELDVLLVVDNSNSMAEEQAALAAQVPRMARVLATGDLDGDGVQDFPAQRSVRVGVVSTDMGTGGYTIMTCSDPMDGDGAALMTTGRDTGCAASYPAFAEVGADDTAAAVDSFVEQVRCVGLLGTGGCGFEQPLESALEALTVQAGPGGPNEGFLREGSVLAVIALTDEADCSAADPEMFNPTRDDLGPLNVRCATRESLLQPVDRYATGLAALRSDPADLIYALIGGVPPDLAGADPAAILADARMTPTVNPSNPNELLPVCDTEVGIAFPATRMVELARDLGPTSVVESICQSDFTPVLSSILDRVAARARGECL